MSYAHLQVWYEKPRELTSKESEWLERLMDSAVPCRAVLQEQIMHAQVVGECACGCKSKNLKVEATAPSYPYLERIPVEMTTHEPQKAPVMFLLHVVQGYIKELEVLRADSSPIDEEIDLSNTEILVNIK